MRPGSLTKSKIKCQRKGWHEEYGYSLPWILIKKYSRIFGTKMMALQTTLFLMSELVCLGERKSLETGHEFALRLLYKVLTIVWFNAQSKLKSRLISPKRYWQSLWIGTLSLSHQERESAVKTNSLSSRVKYELQIIQALSSVTQRNLEQFGVIHSREHSLRTKVLQNAQLWHLPFYQELVNINTNATAGGRETGKKKETFS